MIYGGIEHSGLKHRAYTAWSIPNPHRLTCVKNWGKPLKLGELFVTTAQPTYPGYTNAKVRKWILKAMAGKYTLRMVVSTSYIGGKKVIYLPSRV